MFRIQRTLSLIIWSGICFAAGGALTPKVKSFIADKKRAECEEPVSTVVPEVPVDPESKEKQEEAPDDIPVGQAEQPKPRSTPAGKPFTAEDYKGVRISDTGKGREDMTEQLIRIIVDRSDLQMPEEDLEAEIEYQLRGMAQRLKYQSFCDPDAPRMQDYDMDALREEIRTETIREYREEKLIKAVIREEKLTASAEELEAEAERIAETQNSSMEMIRKFFGKDYSGLSGDVLRRKARELIYEEAVIESAAEPEVRAD